MTTLLLCDAVRLTVHFAADVDVSIDGPGQTDIVNEEQHGVLSVDYLPVIPGEYTISVKSHGKHIHGSPFSAKISGIINNHNHHHHHHHHRKLLTAS